jgi:glutamate--cysteine ligase
VSLSEAELLDDVRQRLFSPTRSAAPHAVGLELELIPVFRGSNKRVPAIDAAGVSSSATLSRLGIREAWAEQLAGDDPSSWTLRDGSSISFEPGGQIEISTTPHPTASAVIEAAQRIVARLAEVMSDDGIELLARGVDPYNAVEAVPLQLHRERYVGMTRYFESLGSSGVRMMRQTAALQINLERGADSISRWRLLNALAPVVVALFANSRGYAGESTGWASYRAQLWRTLDPSRTGIIYDELDPAAEYLRFALDAGAMRARDGSGYRRFRDWMTSPEVDRDQWQFHLSTLFPEVRPKEFFELRSADAIGAESLAAPVVFVTGLVYDPHSAQAALDLLGMPSNELLQRAGRLGRADPAIRSLAITLTQLSLDGARRLGGDYISSRHVEDAERYFARAFAADDI